MSGQGTQDRWVTVATYDTMPDAHVARGRLEAEGIECHIADEHLVQTDWLYSLAVGGIKIRVAARDGPRARRILATDFSQDLPPDSLE